MIQRCFTSHSAHTVSGPTERPIHLLPADSTREEKQSRRTAERSPVTKCWGFKSALRDSVRYVAVGRLSVEHSDKSAFAFGCLFIFVVSFPSVLLFFASASTSWSLCFPYLPSSCLTHGLSCTNLTHSPAACQNARWRTAGRRQSVELCWGDRHVTVKTQQISSVTRPLRSGSVTVNAACDLVRLVWFDALGLRTLAANLRCV